MNIVLLEGALSSAPDVRTLASGSTLVQLQVTTRDDATTRSVPVSSIDPKPWVEALDAGDSVVVLGAVERRFFRAGGATASRTEVVAHSIRRASDRRGVQRLRALAIGALAD